MAEGDLPPPCPSCGPLDAEGRDSRGRPHLAALAGKKGDRRKK